MHLSRLVPALGLLVTAANVQAVDLADGRLHVNGWLDFVASAVKDKPIKDADGVIVGIDRNVFDMSAAGELGVTYDVIKDKAKLVLEARYQDSADENGVSSPLTVAQAFGTIQICPKSSLTVGYFDNWLGLEMVDPTGMNRINHSIVWTALTGYTVTGAKYAMDLMKTDKSSATVTVALVDDVFGLGASTKGANDLASAFIFYAENKDVGTFQASFTNEWDSAQKTNGDTSDYLAFNAMGTITAIKDMSLGADAHYQYVNSDIAYVGLMGYANAQLPTADVLFPMNMTAMVSYLDMDAKNTNTKMYQMEYALALNTTPFKDFDTLGVNLEVNAVDTMKAPDKTAFGAAIEVLFKF